MYRTFRLDVNVAAADIVIITVAVVGNSLTFTKQWRTPSSKKNRSIDTTISNNALETISTKTKNPMQTAFLLVVPVSFTFYRFLIVFFFKLRSFVVPIFCAPFQKYSTISHIVTISYQLVQSMYMYSMLSQRNQAFVHSLSLSDERKQI